MQITKTLASRQARSLRIALANAGIALKHTATLDLVSAAYGLRSRDVAASRPEGSAAPAPLLSRIAARYAVNDQGRLAAILAATTALTHPAIAASAEAQPPATITVDRDDAGPTGRHLVIPSDQLATPHAFLNGDAGRALVKGLAAPFYYTRYYDHQRSPYDLKQMNDLGSRILTNCESAGGADSPENILTEYFGYGEEPDDSLRHQDASALDDLARQIHEAADEQGLEAIEDEWREAIGDAVCETLADGDDSSASDMLGSWDRCEVVFLFGESGLGFEDNAIQSNDVYSAPSVLAIDGHLQSQLSRLGWTVPEFRRQAKNRKATHPSYVPGRKASRRGKLVEWNAIEEAVENACTTYFSFCLYAIVPVADLIGLDLRKPLTFSKAAFATYNPMSGTFFDSVFLDDVTVKPGDGDLVCPHRWYTPESICGLHKPPYYANIANASERAPPPRRDANGAGQDGPA